MTRCRPFPLGALLAAIPALALATPSPANAPADANPTPAGTVAARPAPPAQAPASPRAKKKKASPVSAPAATTTTKTASAPTGASHPVSAPAHPSSERTPVTAAATVPAPLPTPLPPVRRPPPPAPRWARFGVRLAAGVVNPYDQATDLVTENGTLGGWSAGVDWHPPRVPERLAFQVAYEGAASNASLFDTGTAYLIRHSLALGARWRLVQFGGAQLYGRGALLFDANQLTLDDGTGGAELADWAFSAGLAAAAGAQFTFDNSRTDRGFAAFAEIGWTERLAPSFDGLTRVVQGSPTPAPITDVPVDVGSLDLSGLFWNCGLAYLW